MCIFPSSGIPVAGYHLKCFKIIGIIKSNNENIINWRSPKTPINNINKLAIKPINKNV